MEIMKTNVGYINLHLFIVLVLLGQFTTSSCLDQLGIGDFILAKLFPDFKEPFFDFFLNLRFQLLFHVIHFEILPFEMLQRMRTFVIFWLHEAIGGLSLLLLFKYVHRNLLLVHGDLWKRAFD